MFCSCRVVAGKPCVLFVYRYGLKNFVLFVAFWLSKTQLESPSRTSYHVVEQVDS